MKINKSIGREVAQILLFVEALKPKNMLWKVPCQNDPSEIFEVEWLSGWRYKHSDSETWIETSLVGLIRALENNDVHLKLFRQQLEDYALGSASCAYDIVQEACRIFGEETVYEKIEDNYEQLSKQIEQIVDGDYDISPVLKILTKK